MRTSCVELMGIQERSPQIFFQQKINLLTPDLNKKPEAFCEIFPVTKKPPKKTFKIGIFLGRRVLFLFSEVK